MNNVFKFLVVSAMYIGSTNASNPPDKALVLNQLNDEYKKVFEAFNRICVVEHSYADTNRYSLDNHQYCKALMAALEDIESQLDKQFSIKRYDVLQNDKSYDAWNKYKQAFGAKK